MERTKLEERERDIGRESGSLKSYQILMINMISDIKKTTRD
jgi:hypothetical protein